MVSTTLKVSVLSVLAIASGLSWSNTAVGAPSSPMQPVAVKQQRIAQAASAIPALEQAVLTQINQYRASRKLSPLTLDPSISVQARAHSQAMASGRTPFSHNGFQQRVQAIALTISYSRAAENVAYNQGYSDPVRQAVQGWLQSPGHRQNIEGSFDLTGIGIAQNAKGEYYFTQLFIRRR